MSRFILTFFFLKNEGIIFDDVMANLVEKSQKKVELANLKNFELWYIYIRINKTKC